MKATIRIALFGIVTLCSFMTHAQIAANYSIGTWSQFKTAAVSYTMDGYNNSPSKQLSVAVPMFDQYSYKVTLTTIPSWISNWIPLKNAANNGHEIGSLTVDHTDLTTLSISAQDTELKQSQITINTNITNEKCVILAYPNCNRGDLATVQKYYIAGRTCAGTIIPSTPSDFYSISSIMTGTAGNNLKAADVNAKVASAKTSKGWCNFLIHGIDNDGGYSPIPSTEISSHLSYMNTNVADFWIATFGNIVKYIKERNAANLVETVINNDSLQMKLTDNLDNTIYNVPITVRRILPSGWQNPKVYVSGKLATSSLITVSGTTYIQFDATPNQGNVFLSNTKKVVNGLEEETENASFRIEPNPFSQETMIQAIGEFTYSIFSSDGRLIENGTGTNKTQLGNQLETGMYLLRIKTTTASYSRRIIKK